MSTRRMFLILLGVTAFALVTYLGVVHLTLRNIESMVRGIVEGAAVTQLQDITLIPGSAVTVGGDTVATLVGGTSARSFGEQHSELMLLTGHVLAGWEHRLSDLEPSIASVDSSGTPSAIAGVRLVPRHLNERISPKGVVLLRAPKDSALAKVYPVY